MAVAVVLKCKKRHNVVPDSNAVVFVRQCRVRIYWKWAWTGMNAATEIKRKDTEIHLLSTE